MIQEKFYVDGDNRFKRVKNFIRWEMPSARFITNPVKYCNKWEINISYEIEDMNKLSALLNEFYLEDNPIVTKVNFWKKIKNIFKTK